MTNPKATILAIRFYRNHDGLTPIGYLFLITGVAGILESLPFLLALPLIRSIYLGIDFVGFFGLKAPLVQYGLGLVILLVIRFILGTYAQHLSAVNRVKMQSAFKRNYSISEREPLRQSQGRSVQSINFLLNSFSQLSPGLTFSIIGFYMSPRFGLLMIASIGLWILPLRWIKRKQDQWHSKVSDLTHRLDVDESNLALENWHNAKLKSSVFDSINKNAREFIVITSLITALIIAHHYSLISGANALIIIVVFLRGLQQIFTAYIMLQQVVAAKKFLEKSI